MLDYQTLLALFESYPDDAPIYFEFPLTDDPMSKGAFAVGQVRARFAAQPVRGVPLIDAPGGKHCILGMLFQVDGPILLLRPFSSVGVRRDRG